MNFPATLEPKLMMQELLKYKMYYNARHSNILEYLETEYKQCQATNPIK